LAAFRGVTPFDRCAASLCTLCLAKRHAKNKQSEANLMQQALLLFTAFLTVFGVPKPLSEQGNAIRNRFRLSNS
jgi:hypothetical protein